MSWALLLWAVSVFAFPVAAVVPAGEGVSVAQASRGTGAKHKRPRTRSHRWRLADEQRRKAEAVPAAKKEVYVGKLARGRWRPQIASSLEDVLRTYGLDSADYTTADPPVAVFVWEEVSVTHDVGEALFVRMVTDALFNFDKDFWELVPVHLGRMRIRAGYEEFRALPRSIWPSNPYYKLYRKKFLKSYQSICKTNGSRACADWVVKLLRGMTEEEVLKIARSVVADEFKREVGWETVGTTLEDPDPVRVRTGLRLIPEMKDLYMKLKEEGFDVWVFSAANHWAVEVMSREYGVDPGRVVGVRAKITDGKLMPEIVDPAPVGTGKVEAVAMSVGRSPVLIVADEKDGDLLKYGRGTRIRVVDSNDGSPGTNRQRGLAQPRFSPMMAPQL